MAFGSGDGHYEVEVNKGSLNAGSLTRDMNNRYSDGWKLAHIFEKEDNTVIIWERQD
jgi:hypothetical protein